ncbi:MAG: hypothetical protein AAFN30_08865 [Actinomycetota bacterium]
MATDARREGSKNQLFFPFVWLITTTALLVLFQTVGIPQALGEEQPALVDTGAGDYALGGPEPADHDLPSVLHAGVRWSMVDVEVTPTDQLLGRAVIDVHLRIENTLTGSSARIPERSVLLVTKAGEPIGTGRFVDERARLSVAPGETIELTISYVTGFHRNPNPRDLALQIGDPARVPSILPLVGAPADDDGPQFVAIDDQAVRLDDPDDAERQIVVAAEAATFALNAGPYRAIEGERLAVVKVIVERAVTSDDATYLDTSYWGLASDAGVASAIMVARTSQPASNADEVTLLFAFPDDAEDFALLVGVGTGQDAELAIVVPNN